MKDRDRENCETDNFTTTKRYFLNIHCIYYILYSLIYRQWKHNRKFLKI